MNAATSEMDDRTGWEQRAAPLAIVALVLLSAAAFYPGIRGEFVWDDDLLLIDHANYRSPELILSSLRSLFIISPSYFRPLGYLSFFIDYTLFGTKSTWYHIENLIIHIGTVLLLWGLLLKLNIPLLRATILAALFSVHPTRVESVVFISSRFDLLATLFVIAALWLHRSSFHARSWGLRWGAAAVFLIALSAKEMAVTMPAVAWLCDRMIWPKKPASRRSRQRQRDITWLSIPAYLPYALFFLIYVFARVAVLGSALVSRGLSIELVGPMDRLLLIGKSITGYVWLTLLPYWIGPVHFLQHVSVFDIESWIGFAIAGYALWAIASGRLKRTVRGGMAIYLLLLVPVLNIVPIRLAGPSYLAERFLYLPLLGIVFVLQTVRLESRRLLIPAVAVVLIWFTICNNASSHWISDRALFSWVREQVPQSALGFTNLGLEETRAGHPTLAAALSESALARDPLNADAWDNLGVAYYQMVRLADAESCFTQALRLAPGHPLFSTNLAGTWRTMGRYDEALGLLAQVVSTDETAGSAYLNVGLCYMAMEQPKKAIRPLRRAAELMEVDPSTWMSLAKALLLTGDTSGGTAAVDRALKCGLAPQAAAAELATEGRKALFSGQAARAVSFLTTAVDVFPGDAGLLNDLGVGFRGLGRMDRAESCFVEAIQLSEHLGMAWSNLGEIHALQGHEAAAESVLNTALARWPLLPDTYRHLGLLLHRRGQTDTANVLLSRYMDLAPDGVFAPEVRHILGVENRTPRG